MQAAAVSAVSAVSPSSSGRVVKSDGPDVPDDNNNEGKARRLLVVMPVCSLKEAEGVDIDISSQVLRAELDSLLERFRDDTVIDGISDELVR